MKHGIHLHPNGTYQPLDELLEHPIVRILRALSRLDWISARELGELLEVTYDASIAHAHTKQLGRLTALGQLQRRRGDGQSFEYCITTEGRIELAAILSRSAVASARAPDPRHTRTVICATCELRPAALEHVECHPCWRARLSATARRSA